MLFTKPEGMKYVIIEGNIGAGKSTLLRILGQLTDVQVVYEPLDKWQNVGNNENLLDKFYADTKRWSYTFQTYAFVTRILASEQAIRNNPHTIQVLERSIYSDRYCFAKNTFEMGLMDSLEWQLYQEWFEWLGAYSCKPDGFIYMRTEPTTCFERMKKRNRLEESPVSLDYLSRIHDKHEEWLIKRTNCADYLKEIPVLAIDCNKEFENDTEQQEYIINSVSNFFPFFRSAIKPFSKQESLLL